ncbi:MAG TPA: choice-of-anchor Q domain-containing protein [Acidobacteriaceae bacterium]|nr:choice-of-anchor Q domain-containing protein [Acidobacteriaceae bacterium]
MNALFILPSKASFVLSRFCRKFSKTSFFMIALMFLLPSLAYATTYTVTDLTDNASDTGSLRYAVNTAGNGDTIQFSNVIGTITLTNGTLTIGNGVTITGPGANVLTISGNHAATMFLVNSGSTVSISGLTIANGKGTANSGTDGGAIYSLGTLTVTNCVFSDNTTSEYGGAIFNEGTLVVNDSTFTGNSSFGGAAIDNYETATVNNSTFIGNTVTGPGGGIETLGPLTVNNSTFTGNSASEGGGISNNVGTVTLSNSIVAGNTPSGDDCDSCGTQSANNLIDGTPDLGPLQYNGGTTETMMPLPGSPAIEAGLNSTLATDQRGFTRSTSGASDLGAVQTNYLTVTNLNDSGSGSLRNAMTTANSDGSGDIDFQSGLTGTITLASALPDITGNLNIAGPGANQITVSGNNAVDGFTMDSGANVAMTGLTVANSSGSKAGITNSGTLTISNCAVSNNYSIQSGGGIQNLGTLTVFGSTLNGNSANLHAGGIYSNGNVLIVTNSTFFGNSAGGGAAGGGIMAENGVTAVIDSTFYGNTDSVGGGGIFNNLITPLTVTNSIVAGNTPGDCDNCTPVGPILTGGAAALAPLAYNGTGATVQTMLPLPGSPAIQAGDATLLPVGLTADERGFPRTTGGKLDLGAAQTNYTAVQFVQQPTNALVNANITPAVTAEVLETNTNLSAPNNTDAVSGVPITLTFNGAGTPGGTLTQTAVGGVASFGNLKVNAAGAGDTLATSVTVTPTGVTPAQTLTATSTAFDIALLSQTITFTPPPASVTYGAAPIVLSATSTSGLPVTFQVDSGPGTISGNTLILTGAGTVAVEADAVGSNSYQSATPVVVHITVLQAPLTVTAANATRVYGTANPVFTGTVTGAVHGDTFTESFTTTATQSSSAGSYPIIPAVTGTNLASYNVTVVDGTLTITPPASAGSFTVSANPSSLVLEQGQTGTAAFTVTPQGNYSGAVRLSCSGLPTNATCAFTPSTVTLTGNGQAMTSQFSIITHQTSHIATGGVVTEAIFWLPGMLLGGFLGLERKKLRGKMRHTLLLLLMVTGLLGMMSGLTGCAGLASPSVPVGTYTVTITGTSGSMTQATKFHLTVTY